MIIFTAAITANRIPALMPLAYGASLLGNIIPAQSVKVGDQDYETTVFCGPETDCNFLKKDHKNKSITLIEFDPNKPIKQNLEVKRLIVAGHGNILGEIDINQKDEVRPDEFARIFFPKSKIINAIACHLGVNFRKNYRKNSLKAGQIIFIHGGKDTIFDHQLYRSLLYLASEINQEFPSTITLQII